MLNKVNKNVCNCNALWHVWYTCGYARVCGVCVFTGIQESLCVCGRVCVLERVVSYAMAGISVMESESK